MKLYSTNNKKKFVTLEEAVLKGLPDDNGLFMPEMIPTLPASFFKNLKDYSFAEIAFQITKTLFQGAIPEENVQEIIQNAVNFPAPVVELDENKAVLELYHGPSLAFKDFGARFMAQLMSYFNRKNDKELVILVATSGDTGGAVAAGFYKTLGIKVVILYPSGKVSDLQEKQLTTLGYNIHALEIDGSFDDCQALVKQAFLDKKLTSSIRLSSANSINIARLIPQSFYYVEAYKQLKTQKPVAFCIPSGNFGNLTAGLLAQKMGLPVAHFVAATNANDVVPNYLKTGKYEPRPSIPTISNAMDVGAPSNFKRMQDFYGDSWESMKQDIYGYACDDAATREGVKEVFEKYNYEIDPHGAIGYLALKEYLKVFPEHYGIVLETAHPSKFKVDMDEILEKSIDVPARLAVLKDKKKETTEMKADFGAFKNWLLENY
ncbi:MAG: threonine synthase [Saprospiraceae bacterium]